MLLAVVFSAIVGVCLAGQDPVIEYDCSNDGLVWWGCGSFGRCTGGQFQQRDCVNGDVFDRRQEDCTPINVAGPPCNMPPPDCSQWIDSPGHRMPVVQQNDPDNCRYYYNCVYGAFRGIQACSGAEVYDESQQRCLSPEVVEAPCGLAPPRGQNQGQGQFGFNN